MKPNPTDQEQHRFSQIMGRMIDSAARNLPSDFMKASGTSTREELRVKIMEAHSILSIIKCCAHEALLIEQAAYRSPRKPSKLQPDS